MATHQLSLNESNTPWWYETPSLVSQSTFSNNTYCTGTSQIDPFDITPSQSSGYYDEDTTASEASSNLYSGATCSECAAKGGGDCSGSLQTVQSTNYAPGLPERRGSRCEHCDNGGRVSETCPRLCPCQALTINDINWCISWTYEFLII